MNAIAEELNVTLEGSVAGRLLSELGRKMYFPRGIVAQTGEANARAHRFNATVGMAFEEGEPIMLSGLKGLVTGLSATEAVAYAPTPGVPELRSLWKKQMLGKNPSLGSTPTSLPMVTGGLTNGLFQITELFVDPRDALVIPELFWGNYRLMIEVRREAQIVEYELFDDAGGFNVAALEAAIGDRKKAIVLLNFPNNPTGYSPTKREAAAIEEVLVRKAEAGCDLLVILDDAYFGLFYEDDLLEESLFARLATASEKILAVKIDGATKEDFAWGFRVGFVTFAGKGLSQDQLDALERKLMG
ncbi:MAG TPA: aminotransferase class I/II-fold pyridoxal phosphate-dependent enzyme, partial [Spirochaetia bacterium]|nr:aminotransferase class I/II-fold pyridoxal phosphate-dependent enzyme [Spirochaetia bacterium]